jgi:hypothetical protein
MLLAKLEQMVQEELRGERQGLITEQVELGLIQVEELEEISQAMVVMEDNQEQEEVQELVQIQVVLVVQVNLLLLIHKYYQRQAVHFY